jgi:hypothetical protein
LTDGTGVRKKWKRWEGDIENVRGDTVQVWE